MCMLRSRLPKTDWLVSLVWFCDGAQNESGKVAAYGDSFAMLHKLVNERFDYYPILNIYD